MGDSSSGINALPMASGPMIAHSLRLGPGTDLVPALSQAARQAATQNGSSSAVTVLTAVGSLESLTLRLANACRDDGSDPFRKWNERLEIVSLVGTFCGDDGAKHLHMSVANARGEVFGGHLVEGRIFTTLELVLGSIQGVCFQREHDERTGYRELTVKSFADEE